MILRNSLTGLRFLVVFVGILFALPRAEASLFGDNTVDDIFTVKAIEVGQATLEGTPKTLKAGDKLYFARSPFQFSVKSVSGKTVIITIPAAADLSVGNTLMRRPNDQIKKGLQSEQRLKSVEE